MSHGRAKVIQEVIPHAARLVPGRRAALAHERPQSRPPPHCDRLGCWPSGSSLAGALVLAVVSLPRFLATAAEAAALQVTNLSTAVEGGLRSPSCSAPSSSPSTPSPSSGSG